MPRAAAAATTAATGAAAAEDRREAREATSGSGDESGTMILPAYGATPEPATQQGETGETQVQPAVPADGPDAAAKPPTRRSVRSTPLDPPR